MQGGLSQGPPVGLQQVESSVGSKSFQVGSCVLLNLSFFVFFSFSLPLFPFSIFGMTWSWEEQTLPSCCIFLVCLDLGEFSPCEREEGTGPRQWEETEVC